MGFGQARATHRGCGDKRKAATAGGDRRDGWLRAQIESERKFADELQKTRREGAIELAKVAVAGQSSRGGVVI